ncbi:MAG: hypothetical protein AAGJ81_10460 [Verrucomicrobiota bacterium]
MKKLIPLLILGSFCCIVLNAQQQGNAHNINATRPSQELRPLSDREADEIIRQQEAKKQLRESQKLINRVDFTVVERRAVDMGDRKVILNRVNPPNLPPRAPARAATVHSDPMTEAQINEWMEKMQAKPHRLLFLSATVIDRKLTKIRWWHEGQELKGWSNVDFNYLRGIGEFETEDAYYTVLIGLGNETTKDIQIRRKFAEERGLDLDLQLTEIPDLPPFTKGQAEYFVISDQPDIIENDAVFAAIDSIHAFYDQNKRELKIQYQRTEAINAAKKRYEAANPEQPKDTVIHFWPKRGSAYQNNER